MSRRVVSVGKGSSIEVSTDPFPVVSDGEPRGSRSSSSGWVCRVKGAYAVFIRRHPEPARPQGEECHGVPDVVGDHGQVEGAVGRQAVIAMIIFGRSLARWLRI